MEAQEHLLPCSKQRVAVEDYQHMFVISSEGSVVVAQEDEATPAHLMVSW